MRQGSSATTILFTDIEGSSALVESLGDHRWLEVLRSHNRIVREQVDRHRGYEVKTVGDGFMVAFPGPKPAVECAVAIQRALAEHEQEPALRVRMGLHAGDALEEDGDYFGREVVMAARVSAQARGGEILISDVVRAATEDVELAPPRVVRLKGLSGTHRLYPVAWGGAAPSAPVPAGENVEERAAEQAQLRDALGAAAAGRGSLVAITGSPGLGKSALMRFLDAEAAASGLAVLTGQGSEIERPFAFGVVRQLLEPTVRQLPALDVAASRALGFTEGGEQASAYPAYAGLTRAVAALAGSAPLVILVDDAHWADEASLGWLGFLGRRVRAMPVLVAVAARDDEPGADALLGLLDAADARVAVQPLSPAAVARLVAADAPGASPEFAAACHAASGGVPLYVRELLVAARGAGVPPDRSGAERLEGITAASVRRLVLDRLRPLGEGALKLARACAALDTRADIRTAGRLAGLSMADAMTAADTLRGAGIFRRRPLGFAHPMMRAAVQEETPAGALARLHHDAARLLAADGAPPQEVAAHLLATEPAEDPEVVSTLRAAAASALASGSPRNAATFLERALREPPDGAGLADVLAAAAHAAVLAGHSRRAIARARDALAAEGDRERRVQVVATLARAVHAEFKRADSAVEWDADVRPVLDLLAESAAGLGAERRAVRHELEALALTLRIDRLTAVSEPMPAADRERLDRLAAEATGGTPGERDLVATQATWAAMEGSGRVDASLGAARRLLEDGVVARELGVRGLFDATLEVLVMCSAHAEAEHHLAEAARHARRHGVVPAAALIAAYRASNAWGSGALGDALDFAAEAAAHLSEAGPDAYTQAVAAGAACAALLDRGQIDAARSTARGIEHPRLRDHALGLVAAAAGDHDDAVDRLRRAQALLDRRGLWRSAGPLRPVRPDLAMSLAAIGERGEARAVVEAELAVARAFGQPSCVAEALRARAVVEDDPEPLREAASLIRGSEARLVEAGVLLALGRMAGERAALERALALAERCGANALADAARLAGA